MSKILMREAVGLVPVERAALYRHARSGELSTSKDAQGRMVVDVSELQRYYGQLNTNGNGTQKETADGDNCIQVDTPDNTSNGHQNTDIKTQIVIELMQQQLEDTKSELADAKDREKELLSLLKTAQENCKLLMLPKPKKKFSWFGYLRMKK